MTKEQNLNDVARVLARISQRGETPVTEETIAAALGRCMQALNPDEAEMLMQLSAQAIEYADEKHHPEVTEVRPQVLECDVVRFQNNKEKWVAFVGLLDGRPYEIFTGLQDDEEGIVLPKTVTHGKILKQVNADGTKRYDFQFSEKFNPEYWNYAKLISGVLRYRMPIDHVVKLVASLQLQSENINTWKIGVERALKKYAGGAADLTDTGDEAADIHPTGEAEV